MARALRIEYAGAVYHVMARGNQGRAIFADDKDRQRFLETLGEACGKTGWRLHAYVLMGNHYHLLVETPEGNLVTGMKWLQGAYTRRYNGRHKAFAIRVQREALQAPAGPYESGPAIHCRELPQPSSLPSPSRGGAGAGSISAGMHPGGRPDEKWTCPNAAKGIWRR
jgi:REP element-mobilizing transposase RayT